MKNKNKFSWRVHTACLLIWKIVRTSANLWWFGLGRVGCTLIGK